MMTMENGQLKEIIFFLNELREDSTVNKNIKEKIGKVINLLENDNELGVAKALTEFEDLMEKNEIQPYTRSQIWNVVSMLEKA
ncbi:UPF0147 family protein [Nanoarchaeota archaeon]